MTDDFGVSGHAEIVQHHADPEFAARDLLPLCCGLRWRSAELRRGRRVVHHLPVLIFGGVPRGAANATTTLALWPASISSAWAYRRELSAARSVGDQARRRQPGGRRPRRPAAGPHERQRLPAPAPVAAAGRGRNVLVGSAGARRGCRRLSARGDRQRSAQHPRARSAQHPAVPAPRHSTGVACPRGSLSVQLLIAIYGGYFGGGMGIMMLTTLAIAGMTDIHRDERVEVGAGGGDQWRGAGRVRRARRDCLGTRR